MNKLKTTQLFLLCYLTSFALAKWWNLPVLGYKFQLTEVVFLLGLILIWLGKIPFRWRAFDRLDWGITALAAFAATGALGGNFQESLAGVLGLGYLYAGYLIFSRIKIGETVDLLKLVTRGWMVAAILVSVGGIAGMIFWYLGIHTFLVHEKYLPYWGQGVRAASFVRHPDVLANLIVYAFLFSACLIWSNGEIRVKRIYLPISLILGMGLMISFSKFLVFIPGVVFWFCLRLYWPEVRWAKYIAFVVLAGGTSLFLIATHFFITSKSHWLEQKADMEAFITEKKIWEGENNLIIETAYLPLKELSMQAGIERIPFGQGVGQFPEYFKDQQKIGIAPEMPVFDTHSSYWGLWAEAGLFGAAGGLIFLICLFSYLRQWSRQVKTRQERVYWVAVTTMLLYVLVEGMVLDGLHYRHHWFLLVLLAWGKHQADTSA